MSTRHRRIFVFTVVGVSTYAMAFAGHASAAQNHSGTSKQHGHSSANSGPGNSANAPGHTKKSVPDATKDADKKYAAASTAKASTATTVGASKPQSPAKSAPPAAAAKPSSPVKASPAPVATNRTVTAPTQSETLPAPVAATPIVIPIVSEDEINSQLNNQPVDSAPTPMELSTPRIPNEFSVISTAPTPVEPIAFHGKHTSAGLHVNKTSSILASIIMVIGAIAIFIVSFRHVKANRPPKTTLSMSLAYLDDIVQLKFF